MTIWVNTHYKERCLSHTCQNVQHPPDDLNQGSMGYEYLKLSQSWHQGLGTCYSLFTEHSSPQMSNWLALLFTSCLCPNVPFSGRPEQPHYFKALDHSNTSPPCPFLWFYFLHCTLPFLIYHILYLGCPLFLILPPPISNPWNANFQEARDIFVFIFCTCDASHKNSVWHIIGTQ